MSQVVFITGASSGIGKAMADFLVKKNFTVYGTSRNPERVKADFPLLKMDVTKPESIKSAIKELRSKTDKVDVLINNAGVGITGPIEETPESEMKNAFDTNFFGPINVIKELMPVFREQNSGLIINITSIAGYMGLPYRGIYSASKAAFEIAMEAMRMEIAPFHVKMTNVAPGDFATNIVAGRYHAPIIKDSPYEKNYELSLNLMNAHVDSGENPDKMGEAIYKIIRSKNPKVHYKIGSPIQKLSIVLKRILPDRMYEGILMNHFKLKKE
ncbi:MAG TPA: SDR family oxidoreductase [Flavobacteriaceae bacterium]|nr:SDR family oxidoreductase [Flavobacteriaceae bacterium]